MAKTTLEPDSPSWGPGSQGPGLDLKMSCLGRALPSSGQTPQDQSLQVRGLGRDVGRGKLKSLLGPR